MPPSSPTIQADIELPKWRLSSSPRGSFYSLATVNSDREEREPLIYSSSSSSTPRPGSPRGNRHTFQGSVARRQIHGAGYRSSAGCHHDSSAPHHEPFSRCCGIMEKVKSSRLAYYLDKIAVESEPGLTTAQLMLTNHDLKPVEPERRQWGAWNFVAFWIADSFSKFFCARR